MARSWPLSTDTCARTGQLAYPESQIQNGWFTTALSMACRPIRERHIPRHKDALPLVRHPDRLLFDFCNCVFELVEVIADLHLDCASIFGFDVPVSLAVHCHEGGERDGGWRRVVNFGWVMARWWIRSATARLRRRNWDRIRIWPRYVSPAGNIGLFGLGNVGF